ncbi:MAG: Zn-dependent hydrolase [Gemmatimonadales bacterium]|nr:Zn-dependent hydrolase [Gemmatimonadales bacterium]
MMSGSVNAARLIARIRALGQIGRDPSGRLTRLAGSDQDRTGRDQLAAWARQAGLTVQVDRVGNMLLVWEAGDGSPIMIGSHIDTVIDAGIYDGCYGVLAGLEVVETLREQGVVPRRPVVIAAFTNEEGVRFAPDMMGSLVYAGGLSVEEALGARATDGAVLGAELERIGYAGRYEPGWIRPAAYLELHIEQGPILAQEGVAIGAVENLQGISWQRITIEGTANHAGTTPTVLRRDAGYAAARITTYLRDLAVRSNGSTVATVGTMQYEPGAINVIPGRVVMTVDLRDPDEARLQAAERALSGYLAGLEGQERVLISTERLSRFEPVRFDQELVGLIEAAASGRGIRTRRMTSGAGHDAQMMARIAPAAMIFVPSRDGISHNPREFTSDDELAAGANVLLDVTERLVR